MGPIHIHIGDGYGKLNTQNDHAPHAHATRHDASATATSKLVATNHCVSADIIVNGDSISISTIDRRPCLSAGRGKMSVFVCSVNSRYNELLEIEIERDNFQT